MTTAENAYKTATTRKNPSAPMKRLATDNRIVGRALDYGCGKGFDASYYYMDCYDPYYSPHMPDGPFETVTCNYVLNVIESDAERLRVLSIIQLALTGYGIAYITVRNDRRALHGVTRTGTWQGLIMLRLPVVYKCSGYVTYELRKNDSLHAIQSARTEHP
jgi:hypothetical protein